MSAIKLILIWYNCFVLSLVSLCTNADPVKQRRESPEVLFDTISYPSVYNKHMAPGQDEGAQVVVGVNIIISGVTSFKAQTMDFDVDMYMWTCWYDERLNHSSETPVLMSDHEIGNMIWQPDIYFENGKEISCLDKDSRKFMILVYPNGDVFKSTRLALKVSCMMDLTLFPFDKQTCAIHLSSCNDKTFKFLFFDAYPLEIVKLQWLHSNDTSEHPIAIDRTIQLSDMKVEHPQKWTQQIREFKIHNINEERSQLTGYITMKRLLVFHLTQTYGTTTLLVCISWLSFWLDVRAAPARIALPITTLLTIVNVANGVRLDLPQVSYIKAIDIWLIACTAFVCAVLMQYALANMYFGRKEPMLTRNNCLPQKTKTPITPYTGKNTDLKHNAEKTKPDFSGSNTGEIMANRLDTRCRLLFPGAFLLFTTCYMGYFITKYTS